MRYEPVALQAGEVRSHRVVGQVQLFCKFVYCPVSCTQKVQDSSSRTFEQPFAPAYMFHRIKLMDVTRKSKNALTNSQLINVSSNGCLRKRKTTFRVVSAGWQPCQPSQASCLTSNLSCAETRTVFAGSCS